MIKLYATLNIWLENGILICFTLDKFGVCKYNYIIDKNHYFVKDGKFIWTEKPIYNEININKVNDLIQNTFKIKRC